MKRCLKCKTENAPEAEYCINCGFSLWQEAPPAETALEPPTRILRIIRLTPEVASVRRGERATIAARVDGELGTEVAWQLEGSAAAFATVEPRSDGARIHLHPDHREAAWASPLEVRLLEFGEVSGLVTGTVEVLPEAEPEPELVAEPEPVTKPEPEPEPVPEPRLSRVTEPPPFEPRTEVHSVGVREARPRRETAGRPGHPGLVAQLIALVACVAIVAGAYAVHRFIDYGTGGWKSLWDAARHGGDGSSPLRPADFWTIVGPAVAALILTALSLLGSRRFAMSLVALLGVLIVAQVLALGLLSDGSLRERLSIGVPGFHTTHTPGVGFFVVLVAGFVLVLSAVMAVAPREPAD